MTTRAFIYKQLREKPVEEHLAFLMSVGLNEDQAADFLADYKKNTTLVRQEPKTYERYEQMMEKVRERYGLQIQR